MGTDIVGAAGTASLTLAPNSEAARLIARTAKEIDLSPGQFALVERVASSPAPVPHRAEQKDFKAVIGSMAAVLKAPKRSMDEGKFQLAIYWKILGHLPLATLHHVAERACRELIFMPTPADLLKMADDFTVEEVRLHERARVLLRLRRQRLFEELMARIKDGDISQEEIDGLTDHQKRTAEAMGSLKRAEGGGYTLRPRIVPDGAENANEGISEREVERPLKEMGGDQ